MGYNMSPELGALTRRRLQHLLRKNADAIAGSIVLEQGKTLAGNVIPRLFEYDIDVMMQMHTVTSSVVFKLSKMPFL